MTARRRRGRLDVSRVAAMIEADHITAGGFDLRLVDEDRAVDTADERGELPARGIGGHPAYVCRIVPMMTVEGDDVVVVGWRLTTRGRAAGSTRHHRHTTAAEAIEHAERWARRRFAYAPEVVA